MNDRMLLLLILAVAGASLYISYRTGKGLQPVGDTIDQVKTEKDRLLKALGL